MSSKHRRRRGRKREHAEKQSPKRQRAEQSGVQRPAVPVRLSVGKKLLFAAVTTAALLAVLEAVLAIIGLRPVLYGEDPYVGFSARIPLFVERAGPGGRLEMLTAENKLRYFNPQRFAKVKSAGSYRVFCLGGSTTFGRPYDDQTSFCGWLRELLPVADPSRRWELINAGGISYASYRVALLMEELIRYEPDLFIIYSGQNEFLERRTYDRIIKTPRAVRGLGAIVSRTRTYAALKGAADVLGRRLRGTKNKPDLLAGEVDTLLDQAVGPKAYHRDDAFQKEVLEHYRHNLARMIDIARSVGAKVVLVTPASNLRHCSPFKSQHRDGLTEAELQRWQAALDRAEETSASAQWEAALSALDEAAAIDDRYAHLHYLRGQVLCELQRYHEAKAALQRARDEDVCPLRALGPMREIVAEVASKRGVPLVDFAGLVRRRSDHGIPGKETFLDHVHPTIEVHRWLALQLLDEMVRDGIVTLTRRWDDAAIRQVTQRVESRLDRPAHGIALRNLSKVLGWAGKLEEARRLATQAMELAPEDAEACFQAATNARLLDDVEQAATFYRRAIRLDPGYAMAHTNLGSLLLDRGETDSAIDHYRRAIAANRQDHKAHFNLARALLKRGDRRLSAEHFERVVELRPRDAEAYTQLATTLVQMGQFSRAISQIEKAIEIEPDNADAHGKLGALRAELGDDRGALRSYRRALELDPGHTAAMDNLAWLLATAADRSIRNGAEAVRLAERVCRGNGFNDPATLYSLSAAEAEAGRFDEAVTTAHKALELAESSGQSALADEIRGRLALFRQHRPYRDRRIVR